MHAGTTLDVYVRDLDRQLHQAARIAAHNGADPAQMTAIMSDLSDAFGWGHIVAAPNGSTTPQALPQARAAAAVRATPELSRGRPSRDNGRPTNELYPLILQALSDAPHGLHFGDIHALMRDKSSGSVWSMLSVLMKHRRIRRVGTGLYILNGDSTEPSANHPSQYGRSTPPRRRLTKSQVAEKIDQVKQLLGEKPRTTKQIREALGMKADSHRSTVERWLGEMHKDGVIVRKGEGSFGDPYTWSLN